jgi:hypothetical protein
MPTEALRDILYAGVGPDIRTAERARELHRKIGLSADAINDAGYGEFFGTVQSAAVSELVLSIAKVFERASKRNAVRSIPAAIALMAKAGSGLLPLEPAASLPDFERAGIDVTSLRATPRDGFSTELARLLLDSCPDASKADACELSATLDALRTTRDKAIAHNEAVDGDTFPRTKWSEAENLLLYAKNVVAGLAMAYFGSAWTDDSGTYVSSHDSQVAASQLRRLLVAAGISPQAAM